jgi:hypothetical protein
VRSGIQSRFDGAAMLWSLAKIWLVTAAIYAVLYLPIMPPMKVTLPIPKGVDPATAVRQDNAAGAWSERVEMGAGIVLLIIPCLLSARVIRASRNSN